MPAIRTSSDLRTKYNEISRELYLTPKIYENDKIEIIDDYYFKEDKVKYKFDLTKVKIKLQNEKIINEIRNYID
mgnify:CR=1 FL=1